MLLCEGEGDTPDLTVVVGGVRFPVDKNLLVQNCDYFRALFRSGMRECGQDEIHLGGLQARGFLTALAVLRGERPVLDADAIVDAIECAAFLQAAPLTKHLVNAVNSDNCLLMCHTAAAFGLADLCQAAAAFIRTMYADLRAEVRAAFPAALVAQVESLTPSVLAAVGAHASCGADAPQHASSRTVCYLDEGADRWRVLTDLPPEASSSMAGVAALDNRLYVVGGVRGVGGVEHACFCYCVRSNIWSHICGLAQPRCNLSLVGAEGRLYALGGERQRVLTSSVEVYDVAAASWGFAANLPRPAARPACAVAMSRVFVCLWRPLETTDIYEYVPAQDAWRLVSTLSRRHSYGHHLVGHRDRLYVVRNGPSDDFLRCLVECYDLTSGQWSSLPGHFANSKGALFTAVVRGDSVLTLSRSATLEYLVGGATWKPRRQMKGFPRSGSLWTFLLQPPGHLRPPSPGHLRPPSPEDLRPPSPGHLRPPSPEDLRPPSPEDLRPPSPEDLRPPSPGDLRPGEAAAHLET